MSGPFAAEPRAEWRLAFIMACITAVGTGLFIGVDLGGVGIRPTELWVRVAHTTLAVIMGIVLWLVRRHPTRAIAAVASVFLLLPFLPSLWLSEVTGAESGRCFAPFVGHILTMFGIALLVPGPRWFGAALISVFAIEQLALWFYLRLGGPTAHVPADEPGVSIMYVLFAFGFYFQRVYHADKLVELARLRAEAAGLVARQRAFLAVRDLANTPLQNLELSVGLIRRGASGPGPLQRAERALDRLRHVNKLLAVDAVADASLDSIEILAGPQAKGAPFTAPASLREGGTGPLPDRIQTLRRSRS